MDAALLTKKEDLRVMKILILTQQKEKEEILN